MQTPQTSSTPEAAQAPAAPQAPAAASAPRSITISGSDGKSQTITLSGDGISVNGGGATVAPVPPVPTEDTFAQGAAVGVTMTLLTLGVIALWNHWKRRGMKKETAQLTADFK